MQFQLKRLLVRLAQLLALVGFASAAAAMTVQPVVVDLTTAGRAMSQVITVENTFDRPLPVELRIEGLELTPEGVRGSGRDPGELAIFPPQAVIQPGQRQNFRVQYVGDPAVQTSRHAFVTVAQLPVQLPESNSNIQLLYNFQVLVSVSPQDVRPQLSVTAAEIGRNESGAPVPVITVTNATGAHGYLSRGRIEIVQTDAAGKEVSRQQMAGAQMQQTIGYGLIGGGQTRRVTLPMTLPSADGRITARFTPDP